MESSDYEVLAAVMRWLLDKQDVWLCTIINTSGASPRPVGTIMACSHSDMVGSLSGGCIEDELKRDLQGGGACATPKRFEFGISVQENRRLGLPCGGQVTVLAQYIAPTVENRQQLEQVLDAMGRGKLSYRRSSLVSNRSELIASPVLPVALLDGDVLTHIFGPKFSLLIIGAGHLAAVVSELAKAMDYRVIVCDPRPELIETWKQAGVELVFANPDQTIRDYASGDRCAVLCLAHVPAIDDLAVATALDVGSGFVGALGSMRTTKFRHQRLLTMGYSEEQLARISAPVGLPIGSKTPIEIAVSIMAELTAVRRGYDTGLQ